MTELTKRLWYAKMKKVFEAKIELPMKFASGNQMMVARGRLIRTKEYHAYHDYLKASLQEVLDEVKVQMKDGQAYELRSLFIYPVPKSLINSKKNVMNLIVQKSYQLHEERLMLITL